MAGSWFTVRGSLPPGPSAILVACSFLLPILIWCLVSYVPPFTWHPDVKLFIAGDRADAHTVFTSGSRITASYFPEYADAIRQENNALVAATESGNPQTSRSRAQLKILRNLGYWGREQGYLSTETMRDDGKLFELWGGLAAGTIPRANLSDENIAIINYNWALLEPFGPVYQKNQLPKEQLLKLIPQGKSSTPVYLPAPHEIVVTGYRILTKKPEEGKPSMWGRLGHSLEIVFGGFLVAAILGIPFGILAGTYPFFSKLIEPVTDFTRYMPAPVFAMLLMAILGSEDAPKIAMVFLGTFFQLILVVSKTTSQLDKSLLEAAQTLGTNKGQLLGRVIIPGILPNLYNDMRILLGWAWTWLVIAELIGVKTGLTEFIDTQGDRRHFDKVFPVILLIGIVGFATDQLLAFLRPTLFPWIGERKPGIVARIIFTIPAAPILAFGWARKELKNRNIGGASHG